jgi:hypothetical protein
VELVVGIPKVELVVGIPPIFAASGLITLDPIPLLPKTVGAVVPEFPDLPNDKI